MGWPKEAQPPLFVEEKGRFQELMPEVLKKVFTSEALSQRMRTLYYQLREGRVPFHEQGFYVLKPTHEEGYVSPLRPIGVTPKDFLPILGPLSFFRPIRGDFAPIVMFAHTHPPWTMSPRFTGKEPMIIPSAYDRKLNGGDLYVFLGLHPKAEAGVIIRRPVQLNFFLFKKQRSY